MLSGTMKWLFRITWDGQTDYGLFHSYKNSNYNSDNGVQQGI